MNLKPKWGSLLFCLGMKPYLKIQLEANLNFHLECGLPRSVPMHRLKLAGFYTGVEKPENRFSRDGVVCLFFREKKPVLTVNARFRSDLKKGTVKQSSGMSIEQRKNYATHVNGLKILLISKIPCKDRQYVTSMLNWINIYSSKNLRTSTYVFPLFNTESLIFKIENIF